MVYSNTTLNELYIAALKPSANLFDKAFAWAEAVNTRATFKVISKWYYWIQSGEILHKYPNLDYKCKFNLILTPELVDRIIKELDEDFFIEANRFPLDTISGERLGPDFSRLRAYSRLAFVQEYLSVLQNTAELTNIANHLLSYGYREFPLTPQIKAHTLHLRKMHAEASIIDLSQHEPDPLLQD